MHERRINRVNYIATSTIVCIYVGVYPTALLHETVIPSQWLQCNQWDPVLVKVGPVYWMTIKHLDLSSITGSCSSV